MLIIPGCHPEVANPPWLSPSCGHATQEMIWQRCTGFLLSGAGGRLRGPEAEPASGGQSPYAHCARNGLGWSKGQFKQFTLLPCI